MFKISRCALFCGLLAGWGVPASAHQGLGWLRGQFLDSDNSEEASLGLVRHPMTATGACHFFAKRGTRWSMEFSNGSRLKLTCDPDPGSLLPGFHLWYASGKGQPLLEVGRCIFDEGINEGWYYTDETGALARVEWVNLDGGKDDKGGRRIDQQHVTGAQEPFIDVVHWVFDLREHRLERISDKYQYATNTTVLPRRADESLRFSIGARVPELRQTFVDSIR